MAELTEEQIVKIMLREIWLEREILGDCQESYEYVLYSWGGIENFYKVNIWKYLGLEEFLNLEASNAEFDKEIKSDG